jgi:hypothetical protein
LRRSREGNLDVVEIQMARHSKAAFRIGAGVVPSQGIDHPAGGRVAPEDVWSSSLPQHYVLLQMPTIGRWFSVWHWPGRRVTQTQVNDLVAGVAGVAISEIEDALRGRTLGRHVKAFGR